MEQICYKISLSFDLGKAVSEVGALFKSLNAHLSKMGISEKLSCRGKGLNLVLRCNRKLKIKEKTMVKKKVAEALQVTFPVWNFQVESIRCQTCRQPRSQSQSR